MSQVRILAAAPGQGSPAPGAVVFEAIQPSGPWAEPGGITLEGELLSGSADQVLEGLPQHGANASGLLLFFATGEDAPRFLKTLPDPFTSLPVAGGVAATVPETGEQNLFPGPVCAVVLTGTAWQNQQVDVQIPIGPSIQLETSGPRKATHARTTGGTIPALEWMKDLFTQHGISQAPWEQVGLQTREGIVLHGSPEENGIHTGADLPEDGWVTPVLFDAKRCEQALQDLPSDSLIFGCAGLHAVMPENRPWQSRSTAYFFGEVVHATQGPAFANLSLSVLSPLDDL